MRAFKAAPPPSGQQRSEHKLPPERLMNKKGYFQVHGMAEGHIRNYSCFSPA